MKSLHFVWRIFTLGATSLVLVALFLGVVYLVFRRYQKKNPPEKAKEFGALQDFAEKMAHFTNEGANQINISICNGLSEITSGASLAIELHGNWLDLEISEAAPLNLVDLWTDWPPYLKVKDQAQTPSGRLPVVIEDLVTSGGTNVKAIMDEQEHITRVVLTSPIHSQTDQSLHVKFNCINIFYQIPGPYPFDLKRLSLYMNVTCETAAARTIIALDHPKSIGLRCRRDNAWYYSFSMDIDEQCQRNYFFFGVRNPNLRCTYGTSESSVLAGPGLPLLQAGLGVVTTAFAFRLLAEKPNVTFIAAFAFALTVVTWFFEGLRRRRLFSPSAMVSHVSWTVWSTVACAVAQGLYLVTIAWVYIAHAHWEHSVARAGLGFGFWLLLLGVIYFIALQQGVLQGFCCDECEERIWLRRRGAAVIPTTRQSVHPRNPSRRECMELATRRVTEGQLLPPVGGKKELDT